MGIPDPRLLVEIAYNISKSVSGELIDSLSGGSALNYIGHRACVYGASVGARKDRNHVELAELNIKRILQVAKRGTTSIGK